MFLSALEIRLMISSGCILIAVLTDSPYRFRVPAPPPSLGPVLNYVLDEHAIGLSRLLGSALEAIVANELRESVEACCEVTVALDQYQRSERMGPTLSALVSARNIVQIRLQALPRMQPNGTEAERITELCRITLLLYSDMVLFPLPDIGYKAKLCQKAAEVLKQLQKHHWTQYRHMLTWLLVLGTIAMTGRPAEYNWWLSQMQDRCLHFFSGWQEVRKCLLKHLWWDDVCGNAGETVWNKAMELHTEPL
jgi:hypothetical protein